MLACIGTLISMSVPSVSLLSLLAAEMAPFHLAWKWPSGLKNKQKNFSMDNNKSGGHVEAIAVNAIAFTIGCVVANKTASLWWGFGAFLLSVPILIVLYAIAFLGISYLIIKWQIKQVEKLVEQISNMNDEEMQAVADKLMDEFLADYEVVEEEEKDE